MLRVSLKSVTAQPETLLAAAQVPATARAEQIDIAGFCRIARCLQQGGHAPSPD
jgi:16S rRNA (adenine1518-N6/adenine1519-N6)-dimethyltransferase